MGGSSSNSKVKNENNTTIVNKSDINILNEQLNSTSSNVATDAAKSCSSSVNMSNMIDFAGSVVEGDFNIGASSDPNQDCSVELSQDVKSTFKCVQSSNVRNDMGISMIETVMTNLENSASADALNDMDTTAGSKAASGSLSFNPGGNKSASKVENINNYKSVTETNKNIENVVKNSVESNFSSNDAQECINKVNAAQGIDASGAYIKGSVNICNFKSDQVANIFGDCMQKSDVGNKVIQDVTRNLGITVKEDSANTVTNKAKTVAESSAEQTGVIGDVGGVIESVGSAFSGLLGLGALGAMAPMLSPMSILSCCCCCIILIVMMMMGGKSSGSDSSSSSDAYMDGGFQYTPDYDITTYYSTTSSFK